VSASEVELELESEEALGIDLDDTDIEPLFCGDKRIDGSFLVSSVEDKRSLTLNFIDSKPFAKGERVCSNLVDIDEIGTDILFKDDDDNDDKEEEDKEEEEVLVLPFLD